MTDAGPTSTGVETSRVLSIDAMGGDNGPATVVAGLARFLKKKPGTPVILHGRSSELAPLLARHGLTDAVTLRDAADVVTMHDKPSHVVRHGKTTSMWSAIEAVRDNEAGVVVSCGNTGALMAMSMLRLRKLEGVNRPAIACLWPSRNRQGFNVMLDAGADIRADQDDLLIHALMGASYARTAFDLAQPRVGLLNVGTEEHKGRAELKVAHELIGTSADKGGFVYVGFVEGGDLPGDACDVIVTDGFTGNVALKTGEGIANLIADLLRDALRRTPLSMIGALLASGALRALKKRIDPRRVNGGVFLGLTRTVIKSHGSADETGVAAAIMLAHRLVDQGFSDKLAARLATALPHDADRTPPLTDGAQP
ncbi:phosphate:acyl-[acyl carrier protein] acyltransferase [Loktanella fryxellensis]|uniref:Phosphate acyltransferase n=1 Tax=Loktanella fryxellensis TaxID=245187 RepID=A0A1H7YBL0_9RHOB|nr:phosphate acyltransferase PlsX [Loktanella fryxellensis]SEM42579.1 phosphate:acyl-[acyl carrier protein] acyltransferase [Loktanella fryxellensis]